MVDFLGKNYVAGTWSSLGKNSYRSINPATDEKTSHSFIDATEDEIEKSMHMASEAFTQVKLKQLPLFLKEVSTQIMKLDDFLIEIANWETALGKQRLINERARTTTQLELFAEYISNKHHLDMITSPENSLYRMMIPIGPVVVFPASNFPFAFGVCGGDTASAWAAGCPVIIKVHPSHPQTAELFAKAVQKAIKKCDMPDGFFSLLHGQEVFVSQRLVLHPQTQAIGFTGSFSAGKAIFALACSREVPIPVYAEMGSINPIFIIDANRAQLESIIDSITLGMGQFCTKPGVVFILKEQVGCIENMMNAIGKKKPGILLNKQVKENLVQKVTQIKDNEHVHLETDGSLQSKTCSYKPTLFQTDADTFLQSSLLQSEFFGPVSFIVTCSDVSEFESIASQLNGQLTASIYVQPEQYTDAIPLRDLLISKVGRIIFNDVPTGVAVCEAMQHGGPFPATTAPYSTSVGMRSIFRFLRPIVFQNAPNQLLPTCFSELID